LKKKNNDLKIQYDRDSEAKGGIVNMLTNEVERLGRDNQKLKSECEQLKQYVNTPEKEDSSHFEIEIVKKDVKIDKLKQKVKNLKQELNKINTESSETIKNLESKVKNNEKIYQELEVTNYNLDLKLNELEKQLDEKNKILNKLGDLNNVGEITTKDYSHIIKERDSLRSNILELESQLVIVRKEAERLRTMKNNDRGEIDISSLHDKNRVSLSELNIGEKLVYTASKFFLRNKYTRIFLLIYLLSLHFLVFITLSRMTSISTISK